jgi:hypothetical protein
MIFTLLVEPSGYALELQSAPRVLHSLGAIYATISA